MYHYSIGGVDIQLDFDRGVLEEDLSRVFRTSEPCGKDTVLYKTASMNTEAVGQAPILYYSGGYELRQLGTRRFLINHWRTHRYAYGIDLEELEGDGPINIYCNDELTGQFLLSAASFLSTIGLHHRLLKRSMPILHASYVEYKGSAILFAAPSQVGKSTQAELWRLHAGAEVINGDRVLLRPEQDGWYACGFPGCGTSGICKNRTLPIKAIVLLQQAPENRMEAVSLKEKLHALLTGTEVYRWNIRDIDLAMEIAQSIAEHVPILRLCCRPDQAAVQLLHQTLFGGEALAAF